MGVLLFSLTSVLEKEFLLSIGKCSAREHYLSSTFCLWSFSCWHCPLRQLSGIIYQVWVKGIPCIFIFFIRF